MTEHSDLSEYKDLWTTQVHNYVLVNLDESITSDEAAAMDDIAKCLIINKKTQTALIIEDDNAGIEVMKKIREAGVPIKMWKALRKKE